MISEAEKTRLLANWLETLADVQAATTDARRTPGCVRVIGVSKYVDADWTAALVEAGCHDLGESRPQQLAEKVDALPQCNNQALLPIRWHMIGNVQRNKAKRVVETADVIHSIDSLKLLETIATHAKSLGRTPDVMIEVKISGEADKHGFDAVDLRRQWAAITSVTGVQLVGLMGMAGLDCKGPQAREQFAALRTLRDELASDEIPLSDLSMGMSGDYREAILEGATIVRIGSRLFEGLR